uniref:Uncharacterized protein n=1 Tax=Avena sativa TaxID=4498 RepID=A0ACD5YIM9_AVESA
MNCIPLFFELWAINPQNLKFIHKDYTHLLEIVSVAFNSGEAIDLGDISGAKLPHSYRLTNFPRVVDLVRRAVPLALEPENDQMKQEFKHLLEKKDDIDRLAHKQVRRILWSGLGFLMSQIGLFFRLTFWELSWDVMEPIAFFATTSGLLVSYTYFLVTSRDPTYQDFMERLFLSRRRKLCAKHKFDMERYLELQKHCKCPLEGPKLHNFSGLYNR